MKKLLLLLFLIPNLVMAYEVDCDGYDSDTGEYVYGTCRNGDFEGYDSDTGEYVYGDCQIGGSLDAYNSDTGEYVYGDCE
jgi:hypothetical protein